jgi:hypothetical protein
MNSVTNREDGRGYEVKGIPSMVRGRKVADDAEEVRRESDYVA